MANIAGPFPQRGWSRVGAEATARLWKENIKDGNGEGMEDSKVSQCSWRPRLTFERSMST